MKHPHNSFLFLSNLNSSNQYFKNNPEVPSSLWPVLGICYCQCVVSLHTYSFSGFSSSGMHCFFTDEGSGGELLGCKTIYKGSYCSVMGLEVF